MSAKHSKRTTPKIAKAIYEAAQELLAIDNGGMYTGSFSYGCKWVLDTRYNPERKGILFYSTGWGWRLRTNPSWLTVFNERFPNYATPENTETTQDDSNAAGTGDSPS